MKITSLFGLVVLLTSCNDNLAPDAMSSAKLTIEGPIFIQGNGWFAGLHIQNGVGTGKGYGTYTEGGYVGTQGTGRIGLRGDVSESADAIAGLVGDGYSVAPGARVSTDSISHPALYAENTSGGSSIVAVGETQKMFGSPHWLVASDSRLKENVVPYDVGLATIVRLVPKRFEYNGLGGTRKGYQGIGLIAQEVLGVGPDLVSLRKVHLNWNDVEETEIYQIDSGPVIFMLINAIKEQQVVIDSQSKEIGNLQARFSALEARVTAQGVELVAIKAHLGLP